MRDIELCAPMQPDFMKIGTVQLKSALMTEEQKSAEASMRKSERERDALETFEEMLMDVELLKEHIVMERESIAKLSRELHYFSRNPRTSNPL